VYAIKINEKYIKYNNGLMNYVETREEASHFKSLNGVKWTIEELEQRHNYTGVTYEQFEG
jgi:hypothetical protein